MALVVLLICLQAGTASQAAQGQAPLPNPAAAPAPWRVVLLSGADPTQPAALLLDRTLRRALLAAAPNGVEFFADHVDSLRFGDSDLTPELLALLTKKYAQQKIDLVICLTEFALGFVEAHHSQLWPGAPVLAYGIDEARLQAGALPAGNVYLPWRLELEATLALVESLQPEAQRLVVVAGRAPFDPPWVDRVTALALARSPRHWAVDAWVGLSLGTLRSRLAALGPDAAVFYTSMHCDGEGRP